MKIGHLFTPRMRPQAIDVQAAVIWGVAAGTTALWLIQSLQALKKIAQEHPTACLRAGALMAVLSYLDFFSTGVQRIALSTATNMCKKLPSDAADFVMEVVPLLTNLLQYHDAKVLEHTSVCLTRIAEAFASTPDKLDELCNHGLVMQTATLRRRSLIRGHFFLEIIKGNFKFCTKILL